MVGIKKENRKGLTTGEPTLQPDFKNIINRIRNEGFMVKLDTNGSRPGVLKELIDEGLLNYIAMDVKVPRGRYDLLTEVDNITKKVDKSIKMVKNSGIDYGFRTTVVSKLLDRESIKDIVDWVDPAERYFLQAFENEKTLDKSFSDLKPFWEDFLKEIVEDMEDNFGVCKLRR